MRIKLGVNSKFPTEVDGASLLTADVGMGVPLAEVDGASLLTAYVGMGVPPELEASVRVAEIVASVDYVGPTKVNCVGPIAVECVGPTVFVSANKL